MPTLDIIIDQNVFSLEKAKQLNTHTSLLKKKTEWKKIEEELEPEELFLETNHATPIHDFISSNRQKPNKGNQTYGE